MHASFVPQQLEEEMMMLAHMGAILRTVCHRTSILIVRVGFNYSYISTMKLLLINIKFLVCFLYLSFRNTLFSLLGVAEVIDEDF